MHIVSLIGLVLAGQIVSPKIVEDTDLIRVELAVQSTTIRQFDPLFVGVHIVNIGNKPFLTDEVLSGTQGTVAFGKRHQGFPWVPLRTRDFGCRCSVRTKPLAIAPGERMVRHEVLFTPGYDITDEVQLSFTLARPLELMARVRFGDKDVFSKPVKIDVQPISDEQRKWLLQCLPLSSQIVSADTGDIPTWPDRIARAEDHLDDSLFKKMITWSRLLHAIRTGDDTVRLKAETEFQDLCAKSDAVSRDIMYLRLAKCYRQMNDYENGMRAVCQLKHATESSKSLSRLFQQKRGR